MVVQNVVARSVASASTTQCPLHKRGEKREEKRQESNQVGACRQKALELAAAATTIASGGARLPACLCPSQPYHVPNNKSVNYSAT